MGDTNETSNSKDEYTATKTTIVGVTESGVIRKRSVKKRISRDETLPKAEGAAPSGRPYGHDQEDYARLAQRLLQERAAANAVELLHERWRMIMFMYDDCLDLVQQWEDHRRLKKTRRRQRHLLLLTAFLGLPALSWLLAICLTRLWW